MRTMTLKTGGTDFGPGWKNVVVKNAKYGDWHGWKIEALNDFGNNDMGLYKSCRDFAKSVKAGAVNVQHGEEKEESTTPSQEEVPF